MRVFSGPHLGQKANTVEGSRELDRDTLLGTRKRFTIVYLTRPDDDEDPCELDEEDAMAATGVPALRTLTSSAYAIGKYAKEVDSVNGVWEVYVYFDSSVPAAEPGMEWSWSGETIEKVLQRDPVTGDPIVNAVGEPLLLTAPIAIPVLTVTRIEDDFDPDTILIFCNKTNLVPFVGAPQNCALMADIHDDPVYPGGVSKRKVTYTIKFDLSYDFDTGLFLGWSVQLLNHGTKYYVPEIIIVPDGRTIPGAGEFVKFTDLFKNPTTGNLNLDGTPRDPDLAPTWIIYNRMPRVDINLLDIDPYA